MKLSQLNLHEALKSFDYHPYYLIIFSEDYVKAEPTSIDVICAHSNDEAGIDDFDEGIQKFIDDYGDKKIVKMGFGTIEIVGSHLPTIDIEIEWCET